MTAAAPRERLPNRRLTVTEDILWGDHTWLVGIGFDRGGRAREVFVQGVKTGADFEGLLDDACILMSLLLQSGASAQALSHHLCREGAPGRAGADLETPAASIIGALSARIHNIEDDVGDGLREAYAWCMGGGAAKRRAKI